MNESELKSLVALLEDDDDEILNHVESRLLELGKNIIPFLELEWEQIEDIKHQQRIENIIHQIQMSELLDEFRLWYESQDRDLLTGAYLVSKFRYPELAKQEIINAIDKIRLDVWLEFRYDLVPFEKIRILNYIFYHSLGFKGNTENYHDARNSFINQVLETKRGNPISLAIIYMIVAQKLHIPILGVNLPQHFVLAYLEESSEQIQNIQFNDMNYELSKDSKVLFYINAFNQGAIFSRNNLEHFLKQISVEPRYEYFQPCSNLDIIKRVLRNLVSSYEKSGKPKKKEEIQQILRILGEPNLDFYDDSTSLD